MKHILMILPLLACPELGRGAASAWAQDEDPYKSLSLGDRVQITFRSSGTISGQLVVNPIGRAVKPAKIKPGTEPEEKIDYSKETGLTLDLSWEYPGLNGTMTITKKEIREVKKLQHLDKETIERLRKQREEIQKDLERRNIDNTKENDKKAKEADAERAKLEAERAKLENKGIEDAKEANKQKKLEILKEFPPEQGWGPEKFKEIDGKTLRKQPLTEQERAFMQNFGTWAEAKAILDEMLKAPEKKETPPEEKKP